MKEAKMEKFGVGIIGTGWVSSEHIKAFQQNPQTEVVAICSREHARAETKARELGLADCRAYTRLDEMLRDERVKIVSICTPHHLHAEQAIECAEAGKHLLIEKPIAITLESLRQLQTAVEQARVKTVVSFVLRWNPLFENIKAMLSDGLLGNLFYAEVDYLHGIGPWYKQYEWNIKKAMGTSSLLTAGCHAVDALRWFIQQEVIEVSAYANFSKHNPLRYEYEPNSVTLLKFADGTIGKVASSIECVMPYSFKIELLGDQGTIRNNQVYTRRWPGQRGWATIPTVLPDSGDVTHHPFTGEINHLVECLLTGQESHVNVADAVKTHQLCLASSISAAEGHSVRLPL
jgi:predicted dehydrogenase